MAAHQSTSPNENGSGRSSSLNENEAAENKIQTCSSTSSSSSLLFVRNTHQLFQPFIALFDFVHLATTSKGLLQTCKHIPLDLARENKKQIARLSLVRLVAMRKAWPNFYHLEVSDHQCSEVADASWLLEPLCPIITKLEVKLKPFANYFQYDIYHLNQLKKEREDDVRALAKRVGKEMKNLKTLTLHALAQEHLSEACVFLQEQDMAARERRDNKAGNGKELKELELHFNNHFPRQLLKKPNNNDDDNEKDGNEEEKENNSDDPYYYTHSFKQHVNKLTLVFSGQSSIVLAFEATQFISTFGETLTTLDLQGGTMWEYLANFHLPPTLVNLSIVDLGYSEEIEYSEEEEEEENGEKKKKKKPPKEKEFPWALPSLETFMLNVYFREIKPWWQHNIAKKLPSLVRLGLKLYVKDINYFQTLCHTNQASSVGGGGGVGEIACFTHLEEVSLSNYYMGGSETKLEFGLRSTTQKLKRLTLISGAQNIICAGDLEAPCLEEYTGPYTDFIFTKPHPFLKGLQFVFSKRAVEHVLSYFDSSSSSSFPASCNWSKSEMEAMMRAYCEKFILFPFSPPSPHLPSSSQTQRHLHTMKFVNNSAHPAVTFWMDLILMKCVAHHCNPTLPSYSSDPPPSPPPPPLLLNLELVSHWLSEEAAVALGPHVEKLYVSNLEDRNDDWMNHPRDLVGLHTRRFLHFVNLRTLHINRCDYSMSFSPQVLPKSLTSLRLESFPHLGSFQGLADLPYLSSLAIINCGGVHSLATVPKSVRYLEWYRVAADRFSLDCFLFSPPPPPPPLSSFSGGGGSGGGGEKGKNKEEEEEEEKRKKKEKEEEEEEYKLFKINWPEWCEAEEAEAEAAKQKWNFASVRLSVSVDAGVLHDANVQIVEEKCNRFRLCYPQTVCTLKFIGRGVKKQKQISYHYDGVE